MNSIHDRLFETLAADVHAGYATLREQHPVSQVRLPNGTAVWLVTRYDDARRALSDPRLSKRTPSVGVDYQRFVPEETFRATNQHMLIMDPPDHTRLRRLVTGAFTARRVEALRPRVEEIADQLLDAMSAATPAGQPVDLLDSFAFPLPIKVICELLGVPAADQDSFRRWSDAVVISSADPSGLPAALAAFVEYLRRLIAAKRRRPADDLVSALIAVRDGTDRLTDDELISMVYLLLIAGHETTVNLIGNGVLALLSAPGRWARLATGPAPGAELIEEMLRYDGPVTNATFRVAVEPVELGGQVIPSGDIVMVALLSANRDASRFPDPDRFDPDRPASPHLAFGHGIHYCLGAPLARLEAQVAFAALPRRFPGMRLAVPANELSWRPGVLIHGLAALPVTLG